MVPDSGRAREPDHAGLLGAHRLGRRLSVAEPDRHGRPADVELQAAVPVAGREAEFRVGLTPGGELAGTDHSIFPFGERIRIRNPRTILVG